MHVCGVSIHYITLTLSFIVIEFEVETQ